VPVTHKAVRRAVAGRGFLLLPAAAVLVHELRYRLAYGADAEAALAAQGHGYLDSLAPWLVLLLGLAFGAFLARLARSAAGRLDRRPRRSFAGLWLVASASLVVVYSVQELLEAVVASGHPAGVEGLVGNGGWWALCAAVVIGAGLAALLSVAEVAVSVARRCATRPRPRRSAQLSLRPCSVVLAPRGVLADAAAGRAPPLT
jgi:hypothetical protein